MLVFDERKAWDLFRVTATEGRTLWLERSQSSAVTLAAGATIAPVSAHHYYFDVSRSQLRRYDGWGGDFAMVDAVSSLRFKLLAVASVGDVLCQGGRRSSGPLVALERWELADGPWCGPVGRPFDEDLLRVRAVVVELRVQAVQPELRGSDPRFFLRPGTASGGSMTDPDLAVRFTVAPRNLGARVCCA